jgi:glycosyltransferase involved in cell wall biosynthesis
MIAALAGPFPPWRGGIAQFSLRLEKALSELAETRRISWSHQYPSFAFPGASQIEPGEARIHQADAFLHSSNPLSWPRSRKRIAATGASVVIAQWWHPFFAPSLLQGLPHPSIVSRAAICHNVFPHEGFPFSRALTQRFLKSCKLLVVHSQCDAQEARRVCPGSRVLRLFHPIYDQYVAPGPDSHVAKAALGLDPTRRTVLFFGLIRPYKGLQDLLDATAALGEGTDLLIAGECYSGHKAIAERIGRSDLVRRVRWIDRFIPDSEVNTLFRAADVVALPYRNATQSGVAQIALAFCKTLVLTRTGGLPELIEEGRTGFLAAPGEPEELAQAIEAALKLALNPETAGSIRRFAERFTWERYARSLLEALA